MASFRVLVEQFILGERKLVYVFSVIMCVLGLLTHFMIYQ